MRGGLDFSKEFEFSSCKFSEIARFQFAKIRASGRFSEVTFESLANFEQTGLLESDCDVVSLSFSNCSFEKQAQFALVKITTGGKLHFENSNFYGILSFRGAKILGSLAIERSTCGDALFLGTKPKLPKEMEFHATGSVSLRHTHTRRLVVEGAKFDRLPDFVGMHVDVPVELDLVEIGEEPPEDVRKLPPREQAAELTARWRALKRLAEQARHHYYTALFARNETRARETLDSEQRPLAARVGRVYGALSDYGLSMWRPWAWWLLTLLVATLVYWDGHVRKLGTPPFTTCFGDAGGNAFWSAVMFALRQGSVFGNLASIPGSEWVVDCLYGERVPALIILVAGLQSAFSAVLLFLFLLAVRNHFRIR